MTCPCVEHGGASHHVDQPIIARCPKPDGARAGAPPLLPGRRHRLLGLPVPVPLSRRCGWRCCCCGCWTPATTPRWNTRAFIADKLPPRPSEALAQSFFTGFGITLANLSLFVFQNLIDGATEAGIPNWSSVRSCTGSVCSDQVGADQLTTPEILPTEAELKALRERRLGFRILRNLGCHRRNGRSDCAAGTGRSVPVVCDDVLLVNVHAFHGKVGMAPPTIPWASKRPSAGLALSTAGTIS